MSETSLLATPPADLSGPRPSARFFLAHPAHALALGFGAGLSPLAPGTVGTLWAWLSFLVLQNGLTPPQLGGLILAALLLGWPACSLSAKHLRVLDPRCVVWDEVVAFWLVLWLIAPAGWLAQTVAFALFRYFDAAKPGPVGWVDGWAHGLDLQQRQVWVWAGLGILADDLVAAACTLLLLAFARFAGWW